MGYAMVKNPFDAQLVEHIDLANAVEWPDVAFIDCSLSLIDRRRREDAVAFALASIGLEGLTPSAETQERARRFVNGEIDLAQFLAPTARHLP